MSWRRWPRRLADLFGGEPMLETRDHLFRPPASTWADPKRSGGYGWGQLTHGLGMLFRLVDLDPVRVFARMGLSPAGVDFYDAAVVEFGNGATMALSGSATVPKIARLSSSISASSARRACCCSISSGRGSKRSGTTAGRHIEDASAAKPATMRRSSRSRGSSISAAARMS